MNTFKLTWNETLKLNYKTFSQRCRYVLHKNKIKPKPKRK